MPPIYDSPLTFLNLDGHYVLDLVLHNVVGQGNGELVPFGGPASRYTCNWIEESPKSNDLGSSS